MQPTTKAFTTSGVWSWTNNDSSDTGEIVFLDNEQVSAVIEYIKSTGNAPTIRSDLVLSKKRDDSTDSSFIKYIDLDDNNEIKTWTMNSDYENNLLIEYDAKSDGTVIKCRDINGRCSPLVDGVRSVVLIKVRFNPRNGSVLRANQWWRNRFTMTGSHYTVELPRPAVPSTSMKLKETDCPVWGCGGGGKVCRCDRCQRRGKENECCGEDDDCENRRCVNARCRAGNAGDPCGQDSDCINGRCVKDMCRAGNSGDPCEKDEDCDTNACVNDRCETRNYGSKYDRDSDCGTFTCGHDRCTQGDAGDQ